MIICAAVKIHMIKEDKDVIIHCMRHHYAFEILRDLGISIHDYEHTATEDGFINHKGEFLTRREAYDHAVECGQLCAQMRHDIQENGHLELFSEDLW